MATTTVGHVWSAQPGRQDLLDLVVGCSPAAFDYFSQMTAEEFEQFRVEAGTQRLRKLTQRTDTQAGCFSCLHGTAALGMLAALAVSAWSWRRHR
jgi:hypothetical protein